jgi:hypothetical protein
MTLDASGNLLLGATSQNGTSSKAYFRQSGDGGFKGLNIVSAATGQFVGSMSIDGSGNLNFAQSYLDGAGSFQGITFTTSGTTRLTIASTGAATFSSSVTATSTIVQGAGEDGSAGPVMRLTSTNSNAGARNWAIINTWDNFGDLTFRVSNAQGGNALSSGTSIMTMLRSGSVGIGTTSPSGRLQVNGSNTSGAGNITMADSSILNMLYVSAPNFTVGINASNGGSVENVRFYNASTTVGTISTTGSATSYNTTSDYRLKQDLKDFNGLDLLTKIKTYDYEWKSDKSRSYGVIAHELQSVINYAVTGVKDGEQMQGVDYSKIVPVLIKAIQEQQTQIEQLKNK